MGARSGVGLAEAGEVKIQGPARIWLEEGIECAADEPKLQGDVLGSKKKTLLEDRVDQLARELIEHVEGMS